MSMLVMFGMSAYAEDIIWQEDFSTFAKDSVPTGGVYNYACGNGSANGTTKIYAEALAGGTSPELLLAKSGGSLTVSIALNGKSGKMTLTYKCNKSITVEEITHKDQMVSEAVSVGNDYEHEVNVPEGTTEIQLVFTNSTSKNARIDDIKLYQGTAKKPAGLSWGKASTTLTIGQEVTLALTNENNLAVTYSSSNKDAATIAADGTITLVAAGKTTLTATFEGNDEYEAQSVSIEVTVKGESSGGGEGGDPIIIPGTPLITVAEALEIINGLEDGATTTTEYCVKGYIVDNPNFQRNTNQQLYGNVTLTIADEKGGTALLTVYRATSFDKANFDETTCLLVKADAQVEFQGKLQKYVKNNVTTPELTGGFLVSYEGKNSFDIPTEELKTAENIAALKALTNGDEATLTLTNAQVVYVNVNNDKTELFVRDATGAIDFYNLGIEAKLGQKLNGTLNVKLNSNGGFIQAIKGTNELNSTIVVSDSVEIIPVGMDALEEIAAYNADLITAKSVKINADGKAEDAEGTAVALYDRFKLGLLGSLKKDGTLYNITGLVYDGGSQYGTELVVTSISNANGSEIIDDPIVFTGDGSKENPYLVSDLLQLNPDKIAETIADDADVWVKGFIAGAVNSTNVVVDSINTNIAIVANDWESVGKGTEFVGPAFTEVVPVQLAAKSVFREKLNVKDNNANIHKEVLICGNVQKYFKVVGIKNLKEVVLDGEVINGINAVKADNRFKNAIYNLQGQRITTPGRGLYIINGKKVVLK